MKVEAWAIIDVETDDNQKTPKGESYILFSYDNEGKPRLNVFDYLHKKYADEACERWQHAHPGSKVIPCTIEIKE